MVYSDDPTPGKTVDTVDVDEQDSLSFSISDDDIIELAKMAVTIENHYERPMDIEWGKDGNDGKLYILQARPETVQSRSGPVYPALHAQGHDPKSSLPAAASATKSAPARPRSFASVAEMNRVQAGDVLVSDMTDPDWEPVMKRASAIVTNRGGRTCHAAIIARELGIPAVVGCGDATEKIKTASMSRSAAPRVTKASSTKAGSTSRRRISNSTHCPKYPVKIMMNVGNPGSRLRLRQHSESRRWPGAPRIHHQSHDRRAPAGAARIRQTRR